MTAQPPRWFLAVLWFGLALLLTHLWSQCEFTVRHDHRMRLHHMVLAGQAGTPYQQHMFVLAAMAQSATDRLGLPLELVFLVQQGAGYLALLALAWLWLEELGLTIAGRLLGLVTVAFYAAALLHCSADHPADAYAACAMIASLIEARRGSTAGVVITCAVGGFVSAKHVLVAPALGFWAYTTARPDRWRLAFVAAGAAMVGPLVWAAVFGFPAQPGVQSLAVWVSWIPRSLVHHFAFCAAPLSTLALRFKRVDPLVRSAVLIYPIQIALYASHQMYTAELRSFWPVVPVFAALLASWADGEEREAR